MGCAAIRARAQWSSSFAAPGPDERVRALAKYDDGTGALYAGGLFDAIDGRPCSKIARLRDGVWSDVGGGVGSNQSVRALLVFDGELVAGGDFEWMGGRRVNHIARWNGESWRPFGTGLPGPVYELSTFNGALVAMGAFASLGTSVALWDGSVWLPLGKLQQPNCVAAYNGELLAAGSMTLTSTSPIARWTGSTWEPFAQGIELNINALTAFNGDLIVGGWNNDFGGGNAPNGLARWDGQAWHALEGAISRASTLVVHNGSILASGWVQMSSGFSVIGVATWDGTTWSSPSIVSSGLFPGVDAILPIDDSTGPGFVIGGFFSKAGPTCANNIARYSDGQWSRLSECEKCLGLSEPARGLVVHDDGSGESLYVAGSCQCAGSKPINGVGRWDGQSWSSVGSAFRWDDGSNPYPLTLASFDDGKGRGAKLYLGGYFGTVAGIHGYSIAKWDGREWSDVGGGIYDGTVYDLTAFDDGTGPALYAGGRFSNAGGASITTLAKWDGRQWSEVGGGVHAGAFVIDMMVWNDGTGDGLLIGGKFGSVGSGSATLSAGNIAQWRNGVWSTFGQGLGYANSSMVRSLAPWPVSGGDGQVKVEDLLAVIGSWGPCPP